MYLPLNFYKAHISVDPDANLAKNMFSYIKNKKTDYRELSNLTNDTMFKKYYNECFILYLKKEFDLNDDDELI